MCVSECEGKLPLAVAHTRLCFHDTLLPIPFFFFVLLLVFVCVCLFVCLLWRLLFLEWGHTGVFAFDASMDVFIDKSYPVVNAVYNITSGGSGGKNQCNPSQGCNVCDACCKSYIKVGHHVTRGRRCSNNKQTAKQLQGQPTASGQASQLNQMLQQTLP